MLVMLIDGFGPAVSVAARLCAACIGFMPRGVNSVADRFRILSLQKAIDLAIWPDIGNFRQKYAGYTGLQEKRASLILLAAGFRFHQKQYRNQNDHFAKFNRNTIPQ
ncbi:MAG: hypothetical protein J0I98_04385 [Mesorhizobium sp.]|nr:hypothetical protein [Mesorhizobium sp.]MBN9242011.1 hypothetical protein [Mesorhizobium sp.]